MIVTKKEEMEAKNRGVRFMFLCEADNERMLTFEEALELRDIEDIIQTYNEGYHRITPKRRLK